MRELEVLDRGHLKLDWEERKEFFEDEGKACNSLLQSYRGAIASERRSSAFRGFCGREIQHAWFRIAEGREMR